MLRHVISHTTVRPIIINAIVTPAAARCFASKRGGGSTDDEADIETARKWLARLDADTIRNNAVCDVSFSRSSGPGGQNVNKVSSKATLRIPTSSLLPLLPTLLRPAILSSRYHAAKSNDIVIQADDSRKQNDNVTACFRKLQELIVDAGRDAIPGETSAEQARKVQGLEKADKARTRRMKEFQSQKKTARRGGGGSSDGY